MKKRIYTRREFLHNTSTAAIAGALYLNLPVRGIAQTGQKSRVVLIRDADVLDSDNNLKEDILAQMVDQAVCLLTNQQDIQNAWNQIIHPRDIVGIKTNNWAQLATPPQLESHLRMRVLGCGVDEQKVSVNDRGLLSDPVFLNATALINTRPMRTHDWAGVGTLIKNYIMFVDKPWEHHGDSCADLAAIWKLPLIHNKTRLNILVMLTPLFHGVGPHHFNPQYTWAYKGLLVGFDPVAVDATGVRIIQAKRKEFFKEERPINPPPKHIFLADTRHHLGTADPNKIELIKTGWSEGILI
jgi:hypothetical protein